MWVTSPYPKERHPDITGIMRWWCPDSKLDEPLDLGRRALHVVVRVFDAQKRSPGACMKIIWGLWLVSTLRAIS